MPEVMLLLSWLSLEVKRKKKSSLEKNPFHANSWGQTSTPLFCPLRVLNGSDCSTNGAVRAKKDGAQGQRFLMQERQGERGSKRRRVEGRKQTRKGEEKDTYDVQRQGRFTVSYIFL